MGNKTGKPVFSELKSTEFSLLENTLVQDHCAIPVPFDFLKTITSDFSKEQELGRGGFGVVYKVYLSYLSVSVYLSFSFTFMTKFSNIWGWYRAFLIMGRR
jgi:hypothetical protein